MLDAILAAGVPSVCVLRCTRTATNVGDIQVDIIYKCCTLMAAMCAGSPKAGRCIRARSVGCAKSTTRLCHHATQPLCGCIAATHACFLRAALACAVPAAAVLVITFMHRAHTRIEYIYMSVQY